MNEDAERELVSIHELSEGEQVRRFFSIVRALQEVGKPIAVKLHEVDVFRSGYGLQPYLAVTLTALAARPAGEERGDG